MRRTQTNRHASANTRSRLRMTRCLYHIAVSHGWVGSGDREQGGGFWSGVFTSGRWRSGFESRLGIYSRVRSRIWHWCWGLMRRSCFRLRQTGLWEDGRTDEDQLQMSYEDLEKVHEGNMWARRKWLDMRH